MAPLPFPVARPRVYGCLLPVLPFGVWGPLGPASSLAVTFGRMLSRAKGKGEEGGCPIPTVMIFFLSFFKFLFFFPFWPFESCMVPINKETFLFESVLVSHWYKVCQAW